MLSHRFVTLPVSIGILVLVLVSIPRVSNAQITFTDIAAGLTGVLYSAVAWGDYDNDGDLDILLTGCLGYDEYDYDPIPFTTVYRNDGAGVFTDIGAGLTAVMAGSVAWGDYDNDGDLDILLTGATDSVPYVISRVYRNDDGTFNDISAGLTGVCSSSVAWGDYDNDGDLDILLTGYTIASSYVSIVYRNDGSGVFTDISAGLEGVGQGSVAWGDYDNDGDLDILLTGHIYSGGRTARVYRNDAGLFTDISAGLPAVEWSSVAWGDYDNDGDLDILLTGFTLSSGGVSRVYRNDGSGVFTDISAGLTGVYESSVAWGDYDNDGDLDILLTGWDQYGNDFYDFSIVYRNDGAGVFTDISAGLEPVLDSSVAWGDYDNDGHLDILLTGLSWSTGDIVARVYRNDGVPPNTPPEAPGDLSALQTGDHQMTFSWTAPMDGQTPAAGLSYNLRVGTTPGGSEVMCAMADLTTGFRRVVQRGNAEQRTSWTLTLPEVWATYHWSVQAVDGAYAGSIFAAEESVECTAVEPRIEGIVDVPNDQGRQVSLSWRRGCYDHLGSPIPITEYAVYRKIDPNLRETPDNARPETSAKDTGSYPPGDWHYVLTVPAGGEEEYEVVVPTLADSPFDEGTYYSTFFVRARTDTPWVHFDSAPDSGCSMDNLEPEAPENRTAEGDQRPFTWEPAEEDTFEGFLETARVNGIVDVPNDQGRQVSVSWIRSEYDCPESPTPVTEYAIYRKIDEGLRETPDLAPPKANEKGSAFYPPGNWHFILTVPANAEDEYAVVAPTLADSTVSAGMYFTTFFVRALTDTPGVHFDSAPDSGYSVDNFGPESPVDLTAEKHQQQILLAWEPVDEEDFDYYTVYRGTEESFEPDVPIGYSTTETYTDGDLPGPGTYWYRVAATDFSGNEGESSTSAMVRILRWAERLAFSLGPVSPNPFNISTEIRYGIPSDATPSRVALSVYDATGRRVTTLVDQDQGPGEYRVVWDGTDHNGAEVASGVYFYRIAWNGRSETRRMVLLK